MNDKSALKTDNLVLKHFLNNTDDIVFFKDINSVYITVSLPFAHVLGKESISEIVGKTEYDLFPKEFADSYVKSDRQLLEGREKSVTDFTPMTLPDGSNGYLLITKTPFFDADGKLCGVCGIGHSFANAAACAVDTDNYSYIVFDYDISEDVLRYRINAVDESQTIEMPNYSNTVGGHGILHPDSVETLKRQFERACNEVCADSFDVVCRPEGNYTWCHISFMTIADSDGKPSRIIGQAAGMQSEKRRNLMVESGGIQIMHQANNMSCDLDIISTVFSLMYNSRNLENTVQEILEMIGSFYKVSRAYIFENHKSQRYSINTFEWCAEGIAPQKEYLQKYEFQFKDGRNIYAENFDEEGVFLCRDIHSLPKDQTDVLAPQGIRSMLQCVMLDGGEFSGFVGFDECTHERVWTGEQIGTLSLISRLLCIFLSKRHHQNEAAFTEDFMSALDQNASYVYIIDPESYDIIFCNQVTNDMFGSGIIGKKCYKALLGENSPCSQCPMTRYHNTGKPQAVEILCPNGMWVLSQASPMHWQGRYMMMITATDVTRHMAATRELRIRNEEYAIVINQSGKHIFRYDIPTAKINRFYDFSLVFGQREAVPDTPAEIVSHGLISPDTVDDYVGFFDSIANQIPTGSMDVQIMQESGVYRWFHYDYTLVDNPDGKAVSAIVSIGDVDAETRAVIELARRAERDGMTGLYNKAATEEIARRVISVNVNEPCALMIIDLDNLKTINDTLGHVNGDAALKAIASAVREHFRNTDIVGRIGGDEFFVLLHGSISESVLRASLSGLVRKVSQRKIPGFEKNISCSIGAAMGMCGATTYETLFNQADTALYHVKRNGKCGFALYTADMDEDGYRFDESGSLSLKHTDWFDVSELSKLFSALSVIYPLVISVNLTQNSYYMMEYETFKTQSCPDTGNFDELIIHGAQTYCEEDRQSFIEIFSRANQLEAYREGKRTLTHRGRQLGDDGVYRLTETTVIFTPDKKGNVCQITLSKSVE